ncbi:MAG: hypothetical protein AB1758_15925 [Candidatus Eremiobacterota bacterium]
MRGRFLAALAALFVALSGLARAEDWTITPGVGVGPVKLGMRLSEVEKPLGLIRKDTWAPGGIIRYTKYGGVEIEWNPRAVQIVVPSAKVSVSGRPVGLVAEGGIRVGQSTQAQMESVYGRNYQAQPLKTGRNEPLKTHYIYADKKIGFIVSNGKVISINIWSGGK